MNSIDNRDKSLAETQLDTLGAEVNIPRGSPREALLKYLDCLHTTIQKSLTDYSRTFALRFDLRYPATFQDKSFDDGAVLKRFIDSLKAQIKADRF